MSMKNMSCGEHFKEECGTEKAGEGQSRPGKG